MEKKLAEIWEKRAREFFLSFQDALFVVKDGIILDCNPQAEGLFGLSSQEMKGKRCQDLCSPEEMDTLQDHFARAVAQRGSRFQAPLSKNNGDTFLAEITLTPLALEDDSHLFLVQVRDVSDQRETERRLKESEERLREFVESAPIGIFRTTPEGKVLYANARLLEIFGVDEEDITTVDLRERVYKNPEDRDRFVALMLEKGRVENFQVQVKRRDGAILWVSLYARTVRNEEGNVKYFEGAFLDLTEQKRLEAQIREIHRMEAIGTLVGGIAHEFNNILTGIIGYAELASLKVPPESPLVRDMESIREGARRAAELVRKLAAFGKKTILRTQRANLSRLVKEHLPLIESVLKEGINLDVRLESEMGHVNADPEAVKEILLNLCKNAVDAMPQGGTLTLETHPFEVGPDLTREYPWLEEDRYGALVVRDTGIGIDDKVMPHIFEPFFTTKGIGGGLGLGLSMVYGLVRQHRGAVLVESTPGEGAEFTVLLPPFKEKFDEMEMGEIPSLPGKGRVVLVVEDEDPVRRVIKETLEGKGYKVLEATTGSEALEVFYSMDGKVDLAILDLIMPGMGGKEVGAKIQDLSPHTKTLFISGYTPNSLHPQYRPGEETTFLQKPFTPGELLRLVKKLMD